MVILRDCRGRKPGDVLRARRVWQVLRLRVLHKAARRFAQDDGCEGIVFARLGECLGGLFFAEDFAHAADLGAYVAELFFHAFVAAIHVVDAVEDAFAIGY